MTQPLNDNLGNCAACCSDAPDSDGPCNGKLCGQCKLTKCYVNECRKRAEFHMNDCGMLKSVFGMS